MRMKSVVAFAALALPGATFAAGVNLNIDVQYQTVVRPNSGTVDVMFTGTIDILLPDFDLTGLFLEFPSMDNITFLPGGFAPALSTYLSMNAPGVDYTGDLFFITVASTDALGFYYLNDSSGGTSDLAEFIVTAENSSQEFASDNEFHGLTVVPEPATFGVLGLGLLAVLRRRRKA